MPSPFVFARPSGVFVRFWVPLDLRARIGSKFLVRRLGLVDKDTGRLLAAQMASVLSSAYGLLRREPSVAIDLKDLLKKAQSGQLRDWTSSAIRLPNGAVLENVQINGLEDAQTLAHTLATLNRLGSASPSSVVPSSVPTPSPQLAAASGSTLFDCVSRFLQHFTQRGLSAKVMVEQTWTLELFQGAVGDVPMSTLGPLEMDRFLAALAIWPSNASKRKAYRGLSVPEVLTKAQREGQTPSIAPRTKEKHFDRLRVFFGWCVDRKALSENPAAKIRFTTKEQDNTPVRRDFKAAELLRVFRADAFVAFKKPQQFWAPLLALYSGMRVNEIGQLYVDDLECVNGIWGLHVAARHPGQSLKNQSSWRFVPLHSRILALGFVAYRDRVVEHGFTHLFPGLPWGANGPGDSIGDWFGRYLDQAGLPDPTLSFHSFRHTVATFLDRSEVLESRIAELTGHSRGQSVLRRVYIKAASLPARKADVERLSFEATSAFKPAAADRFDPYLRKMALKATTEKRNSKAGATNAGTGLQRSRSAN